MTTRSSRAIRTGLRRIISDPNVSSAMRMKAIQLLMMVEGAPSELPAKRSEAKSPANQRKLRELLAQMPSGISDTELPGASLSS
jgi:nitrate/nitrite-specific signal transduction histidine kinase